MYNHLFLINRQGDKRVQIKDGAVNARGNVWGTYMHGIFDNYQFRRNFLTDLRKKKGINTKSVNNNLSLDKEFDKLADLLRGNLDMALVKRIAGL